MQFMILTDEDLIKFADYPLLPGITAMLTKSTDQTIKLRSKAYFGCRHCIPNPRKPSALGNGSLPLTQLAFSRF